VVKVEDRADLGEVATCQDGREWIMLWVDNEIAFVQPESREAYRWKSDTYEAYPEIFSNSRRPNINRMLAVDFP
jgi:hypothetical protein